MGKFKTDFVIIILKSEIYLNFVFCFLFFPVYSG